VGVYQVQNGIELPDFLKAELPKLPRNGDRRMLAQIITQLIFPVSHRSNRGGAQTRVARVRRGTGDPRRPARTPSTVAAE
jgi:hypothetical protein